MIKENNLIIRPIETTDIEDLYNLINDFNNVSTFINKPFLLKSKITLEKDFIKEVDVNTIIYAISSNIGNFLGYIKFMIIGKDKKVQIEVILDSEVKNYRDRFKEAVAFGTNYSFNQLNLNKVKFIINELDKENAIKISPILEELGYKRETISREDVFINSSYRDVYTYSKLR